VESFRYTVGTAPSWARSQPYAFTPGTSSFRIHSRNFSSHVTRSADSTLNTHRVISSEWTRRKRLLAPRRTFHQGRVARTNSSRCRVDPSRSQPRTQKRPGERISRPLVVSVLATAFSARRRCGLPFGRSLGTRPAGNPATPEAIHLANCQVVSARGDRGGTEDRREAPGGVGA
jgi:hypothetical protein